MIGGEVTVPGWYPDATGRFRLRYHDGHEWTEHIVDARGLQGTDPVGAGPPRRGGDDAGAARRADLPLALAAVGALLVVWSVFDLAFVERDVGLSLHQLGRLPRDVTGWPLDGYAVLGRFLTLPAAGLAVLATIRWADLAAPARARLAVAAAAVAGVLLAWHLLAMTFTGELDTVPAFGAWIGVAGYAGLVTGPLLRRTTLA